MTELPDRTELRARLRAARRSIDGPQRDEAERCINRSLVELLEREGTASAPRRRVALSMPTDGEVDLSPSMQELDAAGWELHLPVVGERRSMQFVPWHPGAPLGTNRFGIAEPVAGPHRGPAELDVVVLPCVAVDLRGHRLGFGAGFYDRALADARGTVLIATVFEAQVVERVPVAAHDVPVDIVVTEAAVRRTGVAG